MGLGLPVNLITPSVRVIAGNIPAIGILYAFIFSAGVIVAMAGLMGNGIKHLTFDSFRKLSGVEKPLYKINGRSRRVRLCNVSSGVELLIPQEQLKIILSCQQKNR